MLQVLICVIPPVALFMFIQKPHGCLLGTTSAYISSFHSVGHFICFTYTSLTNSLRHLETQRSLTFLSPVHTVLSLLWVSMADGITRTSRITIHNGAVFDRTSTGTDIHTSSMHWARVHFPLISSSLNLHELLSSPSRDNQRSIHFQPLFHSPIILFPMSSFSYYPLFLLSLNQGIMLSAEVYWHRYPLCSTFLSPLLSLCPSVIFWVLSLISIS